MPVQFIETPSGERLAVLPAAEYERLVEAASEAEEMNRDVAAYDAAKAELARASNPRLPEEVSAMLLRGDRLLTALRKWRDMTQMHLAQRTGLSQGYISDIEAGRRSGTRDTMEKIARELEIDPAWLIPED